MHRAEAKRVDEITFSGSVRPNQNSKRTEVDLRVRETLIVGERDSCKPAGPTYLTMTFLIPLRRAKPMKHAILRS